MKEAASVNESNVERELVLGNKVEDLSLEIDALRESSVINDLDFVDSHKLSTGKVVEEKTTLEKVNEDLRLRCVKLEESLIEVRRSFEEDKVNIERDAQHVINGLEDSNNKLTAELSKVWEANEALFEEINTLQEASECKLSEKNGTLEEMLEALSSIQDECRQKDLELSSLKGNIANIAFGDGEAEDINASLKLRCDALEREVEVLTRDLALIKQERGLKESEIMHLKEELERTGFNNEDSHDGTVNESEMGTLRQDNFGLSSTLKQSQQCLQEEREKRLELLDLNFTLEHRCEELEEMIVDLHKEVEELNRVGSVRQSEVEALENSLTTKESEIATLKENIEHAELNKEGNRDGNIHESKMEALRQDHADLYSTLEESQQCLQEEREKRLELEHRCEELEEMIVDLHSEVEELNRMGSVRQSEVEALENSLTAKDSEMATLKSKVDKDTHMEAISSVEDFLRVERQFEEAKEQIKTANETCNKLSLEKQQVEDELSAKEADISQLEAAFESEKKSSESLRNEKSNLERRCQELEDLVMELQEAMRREKSNPVESLLEMTEIASLEMTVANYKEKLQRAVEIGREESERCETMAAKIASLEDDIVSMEKMVATSNAKCREAEAALQEAQCHRNTHMRGNGLRRNGDTSKATTQLNSRIEDLLEELYSVKRSLEETREENALLKNQCQKYADNETVSNDEMHCMKGELLDLQSQYQNLTKCSDEYLKTIEDLRNRNASLIHELQDTESKLSESKQSYFQVYQELTGMQSARDMLELQPKRLFEDSGGFGGNAERPDLREQGANEYLTEGRSVGKDVKFSELEAENANLREELLDICEGSSEALEEKKELERQLYALNIKVCDIHAKSLQFQECLQNKQRECDMYLQTIGSCRRELDEVESELIIARQDNCEQRLVFEEKISEMYDIIKELEPNSDRRLEKEESSCMESDSEMAATKLQLSNADLDLECAQQQITLLQHQLEESESESKQLNSKFQFLLDKVKQFEDGVVNYQNQSINARIESDSLRQALDVSREELDVVSGDVIESRLECKANKDTILLLSKAYGDVVSILQDSLKQFALYQQCACVEVIERHNEESSVELLQILNDYENNVVDMSRRFAESKGVHADLFSELARQNEFKEEESPFIGMLLQPGSDAHTEEASCSLLEKQVGVLNDKVSTANSNIEYLQNRLEELEGENAGLQEDLSTRNEEIENSKAAARDMQDSLLAAEVALDEARSQSEQMSCDLGTLSAENKKLCDNESELCEELSEVRQQVAQLEKENAALREGVDHAVQDEAVRIELEAALGGTKEELRKVTEECQALHRELTDTTEQLSESSGTISSLQGELVEALRKCDECRAELNEVSARVISLELSLDVARSQAEWGQSEIDKLKDEKSQLIVAASLASESEEKLSTITDELSAANSNIEYLQNRLEELEGENAGLQEDLSTRNEEIENSKAAARDMQDSLLAAEVALDEARSQSEQMSCDLGTLSAENKKLCDNESELCEELSEVRQQVAQLEKENAALREGVDHAVQDEAVRIELEAALGGTKEELRKVTEECQALHRELTDTTEQLSESSGTISSLQGELVEALRKCDECRAELNEVSARVISLELSLDVARSQAEWGQSEIDKLKDEKSQLIVAASLASESEEKLSTITDELSAANSNIEYLQNRLEELEGENAGLQEDLSTRNEEIENSKAAARDMQDSLLAAEVALDEARSQSEQMSCDLGTLSAENKKLCDNESELCEELSEVRQQVAQLEKENAALREGVDHAVQDEAVRIELEAALGGTKEELRKVTEECQALHRELTDTTEQLSESSGTISSLQGELVEALRKCDECRAELNEVSARVISLELSLDVARSQAEWGQSEIDKLKDEKSQLIVAASLASESEEKLSTITDELSAANSNIEYLQNRLEELEGENAGLQEDLSTRNEEIENSKAAARDMQDSLLAAEVALDEARSQSEQMSCDLGTLSAENKKLCDNESELCEELSEVRQQVAQLEKENAALREGVDHAVQDEAVRIELEAALGGTKEELRKVTEECQALHRELTDTTEQLSESSGTISSLQGELVEALRKCDECRAELNEVSARVISLELSLDVARSQAEWGQSEIDKLKDEKSQLIVAASLASESEEKLSTITDELSAANSNIEYLQNRLEELEGENAGLQEDLSTRNEEIENSKAAARDMQDSLLAAEVALDEARSQSEQMSCDLGTLSAENKKLCDNESELCEELSEVRQQVAQLEKENAALREGVDHAVQDEAVRIELEAALGGTKEELRKVTEECQALHRELTDTTEQLSESSGTISSLQGELVEALRKCDECRAELNEVSARVISLELSLDEARSQAEWGQSEIDKLKDEKSQLIAAASLASESMVNSAALSEAVRKCDDLELALQEAQSRADLKQSEVDNLNEENGKLSDYGSRVAGELASVKAMYEQQLSQMKEEKENDAFDIENLELQLEKMRKKNAKLSGELQEVKSSFVGEDQNGKLPDVSSRKHENGESTSEIKVGSDDEKGVSKLEAALRDAENRLSLQAKKIENLKSSRLRVQEEVDKQTTALQLEVQRLTEENAKFMSDMKTKNKHINELQEAYKVLSQKVPGFEEVLVESPHIQVENLDMTAQLRKAKADLEEALRENLAFQQRLSDDKIEKLKLSEQLHHLLEERKLPQSFQGMNGIENRCEGDGVLEGNSSANELHIANAKISQQVKNIDSQKSSRLRLQEEVDKQTTALQLEVQRLAEDRSNLVNELKGKDKLISELQRHYHSIQQQNSDIGGDNHVMNDEMAELQSNLSDMKNKLDDAQATVDDLQQRIGNAEVEKESITHHLEGNIAELKEELAKVTSENEEAQQKISDMPGLISENEMLEKKLFDLTRGMESLQDSMLSQEKAAADLESVLQEAREKIDYHVKESQSYEAIVDELTEELKRLQHQNNELMQRLSPSDDNSDSEFKKSAVDEVPAQDSIHAMQSDENQRLRNVIQAQEEEIQLMKDTIESTRNSIDVETIQQELIDAQELIGFQSKKIESLKNTRDQLQDQLDKLGTALNNFDERNDLDGNDSETLKETISKLEEQLAVVTEESEITRVEADLMIKQIDEIEAEKLALSKENQTLQEEILQYTSSESATSSKASHNINSPTMTSRKSDSSDVDDGNVQSIEQSLEVDKLRKSLEKIKRKCEQLEKESEEQDEAIDQLLVEKEHLEKEIQELKSNSPKTGPDGENDDKNHELNARVEILEGKFMSCVKWNMFVDIFLL